MKALSLPDEQVNLRDLVDPKYGMISDFREIPEPPGESSLFIYRAILAFAFDDEPVRANVSAYGSGPSRSDAIAACLSEAVERYSYLCPPLDEFPLASWKELGKNALHPHLLPGFSESQYKQTDFPYSPFTEETRVRWVEGYSLVHTRAVWIPIQFVYGRVREEIKIFRVSSTGFATASSMEKAILGGLLETVERDSFMILWMNKISMPVVDLKGDEGGPLARWFQEKLARPQVRYRVMNMTTDLGIPAFCAIARQIQGEGPMMAMGASCSLDFSAAVSKALTEAATNRSLAVHQPKEPDHRPESEILSQMAPTISDHVKVYLNPGLTHYADFVDSSPVRQSPQELPNYSCGDLKKDLAWCIKRLADKGHDILVVDTTKKELAETGLKAVKVVVPGLQPLHFGWKMEFLRNKRLYEAAKTLGYSNHVKTEDEIYRIPHPFP